MRENENQVNYQYVNIRDIWITIRQFMIGLQGFDACLEKYKNDNSKMPLFIKQCQYLVENGWDDIFENEHFPNKQEINNNDEIGFMLGVLCPLLTTPAEVLNKNITNNSHAFLTCIVRCILFRFLFDAYKDESINIEERYSWFSRIQLLLMNQLNVFEHEKIRYKDQYIDQDNVNKDKYNSAALQYFHGDLGDRFDKVRKMSAGLGYLAFITGNWRVISETFNFDLHPYLELVIVTVFCYSVAIGIPSEMRRFASTYASAALEKITFYESAKPSLVQNRQLYEDISSNDNSKFFIVSESEIDELLVGRVGIEPTTY